MNRADKNNLLGQIGENIVYNYLRSADLNAFLSEDPYDSEKDIRVVEGRKEYTVEVKTQERFHMEAAFTVRTNQLKKCLSVDFLFFVETPSRDDYRVKVWYAPKREYTIYRTRDDREMILFPIDQMVPVATISETKLCDKMKKLSCSKW